MFHPIPGAAPETIVSLVPSTTDSLLSLGLGQKLIGITDYCPWPENMGRITRVGGPKTANLDQILDLHPQLVLANQEENAKETVEALDAKSIPVWVMFPKTVKQAVSDLFDLVALCPSHAGMLQVQWLERAFAWSAASQPLSKVKIFCPIWRTDPLVENTRWMSFTADTYAADLLRVCGAENVAVVDSDTRYPEVSLDAIRSASPQAVLLPSEPFLFGEEEAAFFRKELGLSNQQVRLWDGRDLFWHGTRLGNALQTLPAWIQSIRDKSSSA
jgi:ABC-type Fe3+-hydroxamate transport system substrate-binding protein